MSASTVVDDDPAAESPPPPTVVWLLRLTLVYAVVELGVLMDLAVTARWGLVIPVVLAPLLRVALGLATWRGRNGARIALVVLDVLGVFLGALAVGSSLARGVSLLGVVSVVEVLLIGAVLVLVLRRSTADWCHRAAARRRGEDPDVVRPDVPRGVGTSTVTLRQGSGPVAGRPLIIVPEEQAPTEEAGAGTRGCQMCATRWRSHVASLTDSGQLAEQPGAEVEAVVSWSGVVGLTCGTCGGSACRDHMIRVGVGSGANAESRCPSCSGRLLPG